MQQGVEDKDQTNEALAAFGLKREQDHEPEPPELWTENHPALKVFVALETQWTVGMRGAIGLRMEAMPIALEMQGIERVSWPTVIEDVKVLERETLRIWREQSGG